MSEIPIKSALTNPAVAFCWKAWNDTYNAQIEKGEDPEDAEEWADAAYRKALPPPLGARNIRHFIVCVTYGTAMGIFSSDESSRLLYAAQVAHTTRRTRKSKDKTPASSADKSHSGAIQSGLSAVQEPSSEPAQAA